MSRYRVYWSKAYYDSGDFTIEADSPEDAQGKADDIIGDLQGNMQYCPEDNTIEVVEDEL